LEQNHIETWQKNIISLLDTVLKSEDPTMMGLTLKYAANYFTLRHKEEIAEEMSDIAKKYIP